MTDVKMRINSLLLELFERECPESMCSVSLLSESIGLSASRFMLLILEIEKEFSIIFPVETLAHEDISNMNNLKREVEKLIAIKQGG